MRLPPDTRASRILWSIPAALILGLWTIGVLGAAVTGFITPYSFGEVLERIAQGGWRMLWPGEYGRYSDWFLGMLAQSGPLFAALLWALCLVPHRTRRRRIVTLSATLLIPAGFMILRPQLLLTSLTTAWPSIFGITTGEEWQDGNVALTGMALWWWLLVPLIVMTAQRHVAGPNECPACGYSTIGLPSDKCPECGTTIARTLQSNSRAR